MRKHQWGDYRQGATEAQSSRMLEEILDKIDTMERHELEELAKGLEMVRYKSQGNATLRETLKMKASLLSFRFLLALYEWLFPSYTEDELV